MTVGCLYLPNGNPAPGPKFDYKLRWFDRLAAHAKTLLATGAVRRRHGLQLGGRVHAALMLGVVLSEN